MHNIRRVDAEEIVKDFGQFRSIRHTIQAVLLFQKKQVGIRYIERICFWQLCPAYIFRDISATLPSGMKQNVLSGFGLILFPASPEFSAISPERDKSQYSAKFTFSNFTLQRS